MRPQFPERILKLPCLQPEHENPRKQKQLLRHLLRLLSVLETLSHLLEQSVQLPLVKTFMGLVAENQEGKALEGQAVLGLDC